MGVARTLRLGGRSNVRSTIAVQQRIRRRLPTGVPDTFHTLTYQAGSEMQVNRKSRRSAQATLIVLAGMALFLLACSTEAPDPTPAPASPIGQGATAPVSTLAPLPSTVAAKPPTATSPLPTETQPTDAPTATPTPEPVATPPLQTPVVHLVILPIAVAEPGDDIPAYDRNDWRHWIDEDGDCQDARQEALIAESLTSVTYQSDRRCRVTTGQWSAPYTGTIVNVPGDLDIDHLVPLANAHRSGAWQWSSDRKRQYANYLDDPQHLIAVTARANRSKGAKGPEDWQPPDQSYWCRYAVDWVTVKVSWELTATADEFDALSEMLESCDTPHQLTQITPLEKPNLPSFGNSGDRPTPTPTSLPQRSTYDSCAAADAAGLNLVAGTKGSGRGYPKSVVPSARDGDGDGVVCER